MLFSVPTSKIMPRLLKLAEMKEQDRIHILENPKYYRNDTDFFTKQEYIARENRLISERDKILEQYEYIQENGIEYVYLSLSEIKELGIYDEKEDD